MNFLRRHTTLTVWALIAFFIFVGMSPTFYEWNSRGRIHDDRYFELVHNFPTDYNLYLSRIREGKEGAWLAREKYTSEPHAGSLSQELYVLIGRLSDWAHIQTPYVWFSYHVARAFFAVFLLFMIWKVCEWALPTFGWQILAFLLVVTASTWPKFEWVDGLPRFGGYMPWYTMVDSLQRTTFMPHVLLAQALLLFIIWAFSGGFITKRHPGNWIFLGIVGFILGIVFPPGLLFLYGVLASTTCFEVIALWLASQSGPPTFKKRLTSWAIRDLSGRIIFGLLTIPSFIYYALLLSQYPWKRLVEFDVLHPTKFSYIEYFLALGATLPLGIVGGLGVVFEKQKASLSKFRFFVTWIATWLGLLLLFDKIPQQSPTRFTQMAPHIPLGILTAYLIYKLSVVLRAKKYIIRGFPVQAYKVVVLIPVVVIVLGLGTMTSSYMWLRDFVDHKLRATLPLVPHDAEVMYPMRGIIEAIGWLQDNSPRDGVVLSGFTTGNYIPVYSGNTTYVGHANTVHLEIKMAEVGNFYTNHNPIEVEKTWLSAMHIAYIFYGPEEYETAQGLEDLRQWYPFLIQVYQNPSVRIYKVP